GLNPSDLAMHVVLPELDGRILAGVLSFKEGDNSASLVNRPEPDRVEQVADRIARFLALQSAPRHERKIVILMPDYPSAPGRTGYAVGLDVPQSVLEMLGMLSQAGYRVEDIPASARALLDRLANPAEGMALETYHTLFAQLPDEAWGAVTSAWGPPGDDADTAGGTFRFRAAQFGNIIVALAPDRGRNTD